MARERDPLQEGEPRATEIMVQPPAATQLLQMADLWATMQKEWHAAGLEPPHSARVWMTGSPSSASGVQSLPRSGPTQPAGASSDAPTDTPASDATQASDAQQVGDARHASSAKQAGKAGHASDAKQAGDAEHAVDAEQAGDAQQAVDDQRDVLSFEEQKAAYERQLREWYRDPAVFMLVGVRSMGDERAGEVVAFIVSRFDEGPPRHGRLIDLYVQPSLRGNELARHMVEASSGWMRAQGAEFMEADVLTRNRAGMAFLASTNFHLHSSILRKRL